METYKPKTKLGRVLGKMGSGVARLLSVGRKQKHIRPPHEDLPDAKQEQPSGDNSLAPARLVNEDNQQKAAERTSESIGETGNAKKPVPAKPQKEDTMVKYTRTIARATVGVLIATTIYAVFAGFQWWEIRQSSIQTQQMIEASSRPWVALDGDPELDGELEFGGDGSPHARINFTARNEGGSPAFNYVVNASFITYEPERGQNVPFPECSAYGTFDDLSHKFSKVILPHRDRTQTRDIFQRVSKEERDKPNLNSSVIYLVGCVAYNDKVNEQPIPYGGSKDTPRLSTSFIEQFVSVDDDRMLDHTKRYKGHFESVGSSVYLK